MCLVWGSVIQGGRIDAQEGEVVWGSAVEGGVLGTEQARSFCEVQECDKALSPCVL